MSRKIGLFPAPEIRGENVGLETKDDEADKNDQRHDLGDGGDGVQRGRLLDATQNQYVGQPKNDRSTEQRRDRGAIAEDRKERSQC